VVGNESVGVGMEFKPEVFKARILHSSKYPPSRPSSCPRGSPILPFTLVSPLPKTMPETLAQNARAIRLRELHKPGDHLILCNVYDGETARIVLQHGGAKAVATSSYAVAAVRGKRGEDLKPEILVSAVRDITSVIESNSSSRSQEQLVPLTVDMRDGWGDRLESTVQGIIDAGAVGCNLEDEDGETGELMTLTEGSDRVSRVLREASRLGVPDFVINARTDILGHGGTISDATERGKAYLAAGATSVFVWGGLKGRGVSCEEVKQLVQAFDGRLNVRLKTGPGYLTIPELRELGVARVSLGRELQDIAMQAYKQAVARLLG
jgi:2-methylisocitrate lyase-like PEP mutase family enzyme